MMPLQKRSQQTRTRLLHSARHCFAQFGYDGASVASICEHAGVSKGAFYHHFPSKQALFLELLDHWLSALDSRLDAVLSATQSLPEQLEAMAAQVGSVLEDAGGQLPMYLEFMQQAVHDDVIWEHTLKPFQRYHDRFTILLDVGIRSGSLKPMHAPTAARTLVAVAVGLLLQAALEPQQEDWADVMQSSITLILDGFRASDETRST